MLQRFFIVCLLAFGVLLNTSFKKLPNKDDYYIIVDKSDYEMMVYDADDNWQVTYPCVFGNKDLGDKMMQGDRKTPEGTFHIIGKRPHAKWNKFLALDYPTAESIEKFNDRKAKGLIPADAKIGGEIGIHGTWPHEEFAVDLFQNWTQGCVSTKNEYVKTLFNAIPIGTKVIIRK
ncbi:MAG: L,D-transpeptidase family protein [Chitinophagaceae bacterium]